MLLNLSSFIAIIISYGTSVIMKNPQDKLSINEYSTDPFYILLGNETSDIGQSLKQHCMLNDYKLFQNIQITCCTLTAQLSQLTIQNEMNNKG